MKLKSSRFLVRWTAIVLTFAASAALVPAAAGAQSIETRQPVNQRLAVRVTGDCLAQANLAERIEHWLGNGGIAGDLQIDLAGGETPQVDLVLTLSRPPEAPVVRRLVFKPGSCEGLGEAVSLVIAMAIDAAAVSRIQATPALPQTPAPPFRRSLALSAGPVVPVIFLGDGFALGGALAAEFWFAPHLTAELTLSYIPNSPVAVGTGTAQVALLFAGLRGCAVTKTATQRLRLGGCAALLGGALSAQGEGFASPRAGAGPWFAVSTAADARISITDNFEFFARADLAMAIVRPTLDVRQIQGIVVASRPIGSVVGVLQIGAAVRFF